MFHKPIDEIFPNPPEGLERALLDETRIPKHVAVIMDGNGRWAKKRALNRLKGHKAGIEAVRETIRAASDSGVEFLTIYSFSTENWKRPDEEVEGLMNLFAKTMLAEVDGLHDAAVDKVHQSNDSDEKENLQNDLKCFIHFMCFYLFPKSDKVIKMIYEMQYYC